MSLDEMRHMFEQWPRITGEPGGVDYIETDAGGVPALWAAPKNCAQDRVVLCAHGGGYVVGSMYTHRKTYGHVAKAIGCRALIVDYRRAPENAHPGPVNDMARGYKWLLDQCIQPNHIAFIGDSAGGGLAVTTILRAREQRRYLRPAPSNPWNHLRAPAHHRLWDRRNGSMRSLRVKRRCCALKGSVPAGRSRRSRFPRVLPQRVAVRGRSNRPQVSLRPTPFTVAMRAWVKCSSALSNDRASDDHLGI